MKVIRDDLWLCDDCLFYAVNGDTSGIDDPQRERDVIEGVNALGPHLVPDFDSEAPEDVDEDNGIREFSWKPCDACGTRLGGGRHRFAVLGEEKKRKKSSPSNIRIGARRGRENPLSDLSGGEIALIAAGVGVLGYIGYRIWAANYSSGAQGSTTWLQQQETGGSPTGMGQFSSPTAGQPLAQQAQTTVITDYAPDTCNANPDPATGYCFQDQGNTTVPSIGDYVAYVIADASSSGSNTYPHYGYVQATDGTTVTVADETTPGGVWNFPLSYIATGIDLVGAAAGF